MTLPAAHRLLQQPVRRWTPHRRALIAAAVVSGKLRRDQATPAHRISDEAIKSWIANPAVPG